MPINKAIQAERYQVLYRVTLIIFVTLCCAACTTHPERPARSSYECMCAVRDALPPQLPDKRAHCLASAGIASRCSVIEAYLAGAGKEVSDLFTGGDAEWADWRADRVGIACANQYRIDAIAQCCMEHGY